MNKRHSEYYERMTISRDTVREQFALSYKSTFISDIDNDTRTLSLSLSFSTFELFGVVKTSREDFAKLSVQTSSRYVLTFCLLGVLGCAFKRRQSFLSAFSISSGVTQLLPATVAKFLASCRHSSRMLSTTAARAA